MTQAPDPLQSLMALARRALNGPTRYDLVTSEYIDGSLYAAEMRPRKHGQYVRADHEWIAAANPAVVIALLSERKALLERLRAAEAMVEAARQVYEHDDVYTEVSQGTHTRDQALGKALDAFKATAGPNEGERG